MIVGFVKYQKSVIIKVFETNRSFFKKLNACEAITTNLGASPRLPLRGTRGQAQLEYWNDGIMVRVQGVCFLV